MAGGELVNRRRLVHGIARDAVLTSPCVEPPAKQDRKMFVLSSPPLLAATNLETEAFRPI